MKKIPVIALCAIVGLALVAAVGATSASATVLCKTNTSTTCPYGSSYGVGTELSATLHSGSNAVIRTKAGETWRSCSGGTIKMQVTDAGGASKPVKVKDISYSLTGCTVPIGAFTSYGSGEITDIGGNNGRYFRTGTTYTENPGTSSACRYEFPINAELKGGSPGQILVNGIVTKWSGNLLCPEQLTLAAEYDITSPSPLYVKEQAPAAVLCKANEAKCAESNRYGVGTNIKAALKTGTVWQIKTRSGESLDQCSSSALEGEVSNSGAGAGETAKASISSSTFGGCLSAITPEAFPWQAEFSRGEVAGNGLATISGYRFLVSLFGVSCTYGGSPTFAVTGGSAAELSANGVQLSKVGGGFLCPEKVVMTATYVTSTPSPLFLTSA